MTTVLVLLLVIGVIMALGKGPSNPKPNLDTKPPDPPKAEVKPPPEEKKPEVVAVIKNRSSKNHQSLTSDEVNFVEARLRAGLPCCPDCESGGFLEGPSGGCSVNVKCSNKLCGSLFNLMGPFGIDRISDPSPDKPKEMVTLGEYR